MNKAILKYLQKGNDALRGTKEVKDLLDIARDAMTYLLILERPVRQTSLWLKLDLINHSLNKYEIDQISAPQAMRDIHNLRKVWSGMIEKRNKLAEKEARELRDMEFVRDNTDKKTGRMITDTKKMKLKIRRGTVNED